MNPGLQYFFMARPPKPHRKGSPFTKRLHQEMERWHLNQAWLAARLRISPGTVSGWFTKGATPQPRIVEELAELLGVEPAWLRHGQEPKLNASSRRTGEQTVHSLNGAEPTPLDAALRAREVPLLSWAQAELAATSDGIPESWPERMPTAASDGSAFAVQLRGDSMEPKYQEGDLAVVLPKSVARNGDLVIANIKEQGVVFKILNLIGGDTRRVRLTSYNPAHEPMDLARDDFHWIHPVHSVTRLIRR
jgi:SOS-response transcriptional repressor LexA